MSKQEKFEIRDTSGNTKRTKEKTMTTQTDQDSTLFKNMFNMLKEHCPEDLLDKLYKKEGPSAEQLKKNEARKHKNEIPRKLV